MLAPVGVAIRLGWRSVDAERGHTSRSGCRLAVVRRGHSRRAVAPNGRWQGNTLERSAGMIDGLAFAWVNRHIERRTTCPSPGATLKLQPEISKRQSMPHGWSLLGRRRGAITFWARAC